MGFEQKSGYQRDSARRVRTAIGIESLEPRAMLAGLVNLSDSLLPSSINPIAQVATEVRQVDDQANAAEHMGNGQTPHDEIGGASVEESIWSPNRDWLSDSHRPTSEDRDREEYSAEADGADPKDTSAESDFNIGQSEGQPVGSSIPKAATDSAAPPPLGPTTQPAFVTIVETPIHTPEIKRPPASPSKLATSTSPAESFHYFCTATKHDRSRENNLSSEPLSTVAARATFVAFSLLDVSELRRRPAAQIAARTSSPSPHEAPRRELIVATSVEHENILESDHSRIVNKARSAMELALAVVRDADATCAQIPWPKERDDQSDRSLSPAVMLAQATLIPPSTSETNVIPMWNNPLQVGLFCLVSMLLTVTTPVTKLGKGGITRLSLRSVLQSRLRLGNRS